MDGQTKKAGRWECRVRCPPEGDQVGVRALGSGDQRRRLISTYGEPGPGSLCLPQAPGRLSETTWRCVGPPMESRAGAAEGNPDLDPKEEPRGCVCARMRVYGCGCFLIFFFSQQILFTYSIETRM